MPPSSQRLYIISALAAAGLLALAPAAAPAQVLPPVDDLIRGPLHDPLLNERERRRERRRARPLEETRDQLEETVETVTEPAADTLKDDPLETVDRTVQEATGALRPVIHAALGGLRPFAEGVDPFGNAIEEDVLMVLLEPAALATLERSGWPVSETRALHSLGLVLVRVERPAAPSLARAAGELRAMFPDAAVDYNFLYRFADVQSSAPAPDTAAADPGYVPAGTGDRKSVV